MRDLANEIRSPDRIFILSLIDNKAPKDSTGMVDTRLFTGKNKLHAFQDPESCMWRMRYADGALPEPLRCMFTGFKALRKHAEEYFLKRNIKIVEIKD